MPFRLLNASSRALPQYLIIGAQRAGTTSLYTYLSQHPQILRPARKEVHFFDLHFHEGVRWYRAHFPLQSARARESEAVGAPVLTGEATPYYLFHPEAPRRIASLLPGVRLIALLRDPVARAYSHYTLTAGQGRDPLSFTEAVRWEQKCLEEALGKGLDIGACYDGRDHLWHSYLARGIYSLQLKTYFDLFDRKDICVVCSENLFRDPRATYDHILAFLGLRPHELKNSQPKNKGVYGTLTPEKINTDLLRQLRAFFEPLNAELYSLLGTDFHWRGFLALPLMAGVAA
ncbi:MAG: sulfotransferase family protein [Gemmatimonadota bacterium]